MLDFPLKINRLECQLVPLLQGSLIFRHEANQLRHQLFRELLLEYARSVANHRVTHGDACAHHHGDQGLADHWYV